MRNITLIEMFVIIAIVGIIIVAIVSGIKGGNYCEMFKYAPMREVPANCYSYFMEQK